MVLNIKTIKGKLTPIKDHVIVSDMFFGEQKTKGGLIIKDDDGTTRGIYPRWGKIYAKGIENKEEYQVGDWVLVEHGRWTRGVTLELENDEETTIRMVDNKCILMWAKEKPGGAMVGDALSAPSINEAFRLENKE
jgi:co-chaperonin GroES (HSP10)